MVNDNRFFIDVEFEPTSGKPRVRVLDEHQDAITGWIRVHNTKWLRVNKAVRGQTNETVLAIAFLDNAEINSYLKRAALVANGVYLNDEMFDIHSFIQMATALRDEAALEARLHEVKTAPRPPRL